MDNITHSLFGWTVAHAGFDRRVPYATATLVLASNAPDIDIVAGLHNGVDYLAVHRGPTHGPLGVIGLGLVTAAIISAWARVRGRNGKGADRPGTHRFLHWWGLATIGIVCHVLMDLPTSYGTRLLSPFVWTWYALDWMPIIDVYLWVVLSVAIAAGATRWRERAAILALGLMAFDYAARATLHERALTKGALFDAAGTRVPCAAAPTFVRHSGATDHASAGPGACVEAAALRRSSPPSRGESSGSTRTSTNSAIEVSLPNGRRFGRRGSAARAARMSCARGRREPAACTSTSPVFRSQRSRLTHRRSRPCGCSTPVF